MENVNLCNHPEKYKSYFWRSEKFSDKFTNEFHYCFCQVCNSSEYTGDYRFVEKHLNREELPSAKEQNNMSKEKLSVATSLKNRFAKEGDGNMSLKQFARLLAKKGDQMAIDWFDNKAGACNESRSDKNKARVALERSATKSARRSKSKKSGAATPASTKPEKSAK